VGSVEGVAAGGGTDLQSADGHSINGIDPGAVATARARIRAAGRLAVTAPICVSGTLSGTHGHAWRTVAVPARFRCGGGQPRMQRKQ